MHVSRGIAFLNTVIYYFVLYQMSLKVILRLNICRKKVIFKFFFKFNHTGLTAVTPADSPKSVHNRFVI